jgi:DNA invertase Pin-like site-specific DNA recombinase
VLLIARLDRLSRNVAFISALMENGTDFIACDMPTATRLTIHILAAVAEHEREMISKRTKAALAEAKRRGTKLGNPRIEQARAGALKAHRARSPAPEVSELMKGWRQKQWTLRRIADELNRLHIRPARGRQWYASSVKNQLMAAGKTEGKINGKEKILHAAEC